MYLQVIQGLFDEPETDSLKDERRQAQIYDDRTLLEEMRDSINGLISEDSNRHVLRCSVFFVIIITCLQISFLHERRGDLFEHVAKYRHRQVA
jgi:hypothetical protein